MLSKNLLEALNDQMNHEYFASHAYLAMEAYCDKASYEVFAKFFIQ
ncbi:H-type ferritin FtnA, partial [Staphylococcus aureus]